MEVKNYINAKFKIFEIQKKNQYSILNNKLKKDFKKEISKEKLIIPKLETYKN